MFEDNVYEPYLSVKERYLHFHIETYSYYLIELYCLLVSSSRGR